jgi:hypothetical protein
MASARHEVLDVVEFLTESGRWPAGTIGTAVEVDDKRVLVEVADERGHAVDFVSLPHDKLAPARDSSRAAS